MKACDSPHRLLHGQFGPGTEAVGKNRHRGKIDHCTEEVNADHGLEQCTAAALQGFGIRVAADRDELQERHRYQHPGQGHVLRQRHLDKTAAAARHAPRNTGDANAGKCEHHVKLVSR